MNSDVAVRNEDRSKSPATAALSANGIFRNRARRTCRSKISSDKGGGTGFVSTHGTRLVPNLRAVDFRGPIAYFCEGREAACSSLFTGEHHESDFGTDIGVGARWSPRCFARRYWERMTSIVIVAAFPITGPFAGSGLQTYQGLHPPSATSMLPAVRR